MQIEFEAMFTDVNPENLISKILQKGGSLYKKKYHQLRQLFDFPSSHPVKNGFIRVRKEDNKVTATIKIFDQSKGIEGQQELEIQVDDFKNAVDFIEKIGGEKRSIQENFREIYTLDDCQIMIDYWPYLNPIVEVEGNNKDSVQKVSEKLGFNFNQAIFDSIDYVYSEKYKIDRSAFNKTPILRFDAKNPFNC